jgi:excisionase family DNA binding protein
VPGPQSPSFRSPSEYRPAPPGGGALSRPRVGATGGSAPPRNRAERRQPERLALPEAASWLGITERHLRRLVQERRVSHHKLGGRLVFDLRDLDELLASSRREARGPVKTDALTPGTSRRVEVER